MSIHAVHDLHVDFVSLHASCRNTLTDLGPSFIKLGQVLASRPDIVREDYMEELCVLQDDVPSFPDVLVCLLSTTVFLHEVEHILGCALSCMPVAFPEVFCCPCMQKTACLGPAASKLANAPCHIGLLLLGGCVRHSHHTS